MWSGHLLRKIVSSSQQLCKSNQLKFCFISTIKDINDEFHLPLNLHPKQPTDVTVQKMEEFLAPEGDFGLTPGLLRKAVTNCPELLSLRPIDIKVRLRSLQLHLNTSELRQLLANSPQTLLVDHKKLSKQVERVLNVSGLTRKEVKGLLTFAGQYFIDPVESRKKMDYLHLHIGEIKYEMDVLLAIVNVSLQDITLRHEFLSRRGQHFLPDRHGSTKITNPSVPDMILSPLEYFCEKVAFCDVKEFELFCKIYQHEEEILKSIEEAEDLSDSDDAPSELADYLIRHLKGNEITKTENNLHEN
uniref:Transcription termination factor 4, mitochondrial-like n=1 Tax=Phallusia mammillata TaxID=59560 RepID=A0A6F9DKS4_9ASCI|nr:transcription termination factor 4, mitochondrial-like [Phallusia mammillata]